MRCTRKLEFDAGHRVLGHQGKCINPHGHRYIVEVEVEATELDSLGMVVDFGVIKKICGGWIDDRLDHGFIVNSKDSEMIGALSMVVEKKLIVVDFNPTVEEMAKWLFNKFGDLLREHGVTVVSVVLYETPNCWSRYDGCTK